MFRFGNRHVFGGVRGFPGGFTAIMSGSVGTVSVQINAQGQEDHHDQHRQGDEGRHLQWVA